MTGVVLTLILVYVAGFLLAMNLLAWRVGGDRFSYLAVFRQRGARIAGGFWALKSVAKAYLWPVTVAVWLARRRPASPLLFTPAGPGPHHAPTTAAYRLATRFDQAPVARFKGSV